MNARALTSNPSAFEGQTPKTLGVRHPPSSRRNRLLSGSQALKPRLVQFRIGCDHVPHGLR